MGFGAFLVTFCADKKSPGARGRVAPVIPRAQGRGGPERTRGPGADPPGLSTRTISLPPGERKITPLKKIKPPAARQGGKTKKKVNR